MGSRITLAAAAACTSLAVAAPAQAATSKQIVKALNEQRSENGIPAKIREKAKWSRDCAAHDRWMALNRTIEHSEPRGTPGYTKGGAWVAPNAVLSVGAPFDFTTPATNPYLTAPYHLAGLLNPRLNIMGASEIDGADCETTYPGYTRKRPRHDRVYAYPGNNATVSWYETAEELGGVPGDHVGLPMGTTTGPNIIAFGEAGRGHTPLYRVRGGSLKDSSGHKVSTRTVNSSNYTEGGVAFLIPTAPLRPASTYHARISFSRSGLGHRPWVTKRWTFTTTKLVTGPSAVRLEVTRDGSNVIVHPDALDPAYQGRDATLTTTWHFPDGGAASTSAITIGEYETDGIPSGVTSMDFSLNVHRFTIGSVTFEPFTLSQTFVP